jgi:hypothetical protein
MFYSLRSLMTFSIRDILWLTVVVALVVAWTVDHERFILEYNAVFTRAVELENDLRFPGRTMPKPTAPAPNPPKK